MDSLVVAPPLLLPFYILRYIMQLSHLYFESYESFFFLIFIMTKVIYKLFTVIYRYIVTKNEGHS